MIPRTFRVHFAPMSRTRLAVLFGGTSSEHEISLRSATSVLEAIDQTRYEVLPIGIARDRTWRLGTTGQPLTDIVASGEPLPDLRALAPDLAFGVLHGPNGEDGTIQGLLELWGIPYVGSGVLASAMCMDKAIQKHVIAATAPSVPLCPWLEFDARTMENDATLAAAVERTRETLGYPCFTKPANLGSSVGVEKCTSDDELGAALRNAAAFDPKVVIEAGVDAREVEVAVLGNGGPETLVSEPGEIVLPPGTWYDYASKYLDDVAEYHIPATLPPNVAAQIKAHAATAFAAMGCTGLARIDFLLDRATGVPYLNELNTMPGFTSISMYPKLMAAAGVDYPALIDRLCSLALQRHRERSSLRVDR